MAVSTTAIGISPKKAAARDSYQSDPAAAVSTSNHASSAIPHLGLSLRDRAELEHPDGQPGRDQQQNRGHLAQYR